MMGQMIIRSFVAIMIILCILYGISRLYILHTGTEILLKTRPVHSPHLFHGDYLILSYDIGWFKSGHLQASRVKNFRPDETLYVTLDDSDKYVRIKQIHYDPPPGELYIKGKVDSVRGDIVYVEYGIERHYVTQVEKYAAASPHGHDTWEVIAAVDHDGNAVIKQLVRLDR